MPQIIQTQNSYLKIRIKYIDLKKVRNGVKVNKREKLPYLSTISDHLKETTFNNISDIYYARFRFIYD